MYAKITIERVGNRYCAEGYLKVESPLPERGAYGNAPKDAYARLLSDTRFWRAFHRGDLRRQLHAK